MKNIITVLVGSRLHAVSGRPVRNPGDAVAVGLALSLAAPEAIRVLSAGAMPEGVARDYLALGAAQLDVLEPSRPIADIVPLLAPAVADSALVFTGMSGEGGLSSCTLPYALAQVLRRPVVAGVVAVQQDGAGWLVQQALPKGARRQLRITVPAVLAINPAAPVALRHSYRDQCAGPVVRRAVQSVQSVQWVQSVPEDLSAPAWRFVPAARHLQVLRARVAQSGHDRMLGAIGSDARQAGGTVLCKGGPRDKAQAIFDYLREHSLVSF